MTIKIGNAELTIAPVKEIPKMDGVIDYLWSQNKGWSSVYAWRCDKPDKRPNAGLHTLSVDCVVSFAILKKRWSDKLAKKKSILARESFSLLTGMKQKAMIEAVRKAIGPVKIEMDARPSIQKWGAIYSFDVQFMAMATYFALRPKGNPDFGAIIVGIPVYHAFTLKKTGTCKGAHMLREPMDKWMGATGKNERHDGWLTEDQEKHGAYLKRWKEHTTKKNAKKGIKMPKDW